MNQTDMDWQTFTSIIDTLQAGTVVSLQGEGEPTLHPRFWDMVKYVAERKMVPYTIVNGSRVDVPLFDEFFPEFGVSLDTVDQITATQLGRYGLAKVLQNIRFLLSVIDAQRITIMTVDYGQDLLAVREQVRAWGCRHQVQYLQRKEDYARMAGYSVVPVHVDRSSRCLYVEQPQRRFYTVEGLMLPCCFMKDTTGFTTIRQLQGDQARGRISAGCRGCSNLEPLHQ